ncbi:hypothetical protein CLAIMM_14964, partial [Cladophialophora immunda]
WSDLSFSDSGSCSSMIALQPWNLQAGGHQSTTLGSESCAASRELSSPSSTSDIQGTSVSYNFSLALRCSQSTLCVLQFL